MGKQRDTQARPSSADNTRWPWILLAQLLVLFIATRTVFYVMPLVGEDGVFADLCVNRPAGPQMCLFGRVDGQKRYDLFLHPAPCYEAIRAAGWLCSWMIPAPPVPDNMVTPRLRFLYSLFQLSVWLVILVVLARPRVCSQSAARWAVLAAVIASPMAMVTSTQLQIDGSVGVVMNGLMAVAVMAVLSGSSPGVRGLSYLACAGFVLGLGKQEWTICLLAALVAWAGYIIVQGIRGKVALAEFGRPILLILIGLAAGNLASYAYDPLNYMGGLKFLSEVCQRSTPISPNWSQVWPRYLSYMAATLPTIALLLVLIGWSVWRRRAGVRPVDVLLALFGLSLVVPFVVQSHWPDPRYLAPGLVVLTVACMAMLPDAPGRGGKALIGLMVVIMAMHSLWFLKGQLEGLCPERALAENQVKQVRDLSGKGFLVRLEHAVAWNKPELDYLAESMNPTDTQRFLEKYHKKQWP